MAALEAIAARQVGGRQRASPGAHAVQISGEAIPMVAIRCQLGHADLAITSTYLRKINHTEIINAVHERSVPMIPASPRPGPGR